MTDRTLKALSLILSYPTQELQDAMPEIGGVLASDTRLTGVTRRALRPIVTELGENDIYASEEAYVSLFDRSKSISLNLFEHVHGESRDRGGAMVSLVETYRAAGFDPISSELPDHLPVLLEYLATQSADEAKDVLADAAHIFEVISTRLERRESNYAAIFSALLQLSEQETDKSVVAALLDQPEDDPDDLEALDKVWEESEVLFGPDPNAGCPQVRDMLANMDTPVNPAPAKPVAAQ
jgi:nitrate reductase molybdenum cofactor assembly chaperone NarJ/NarW